MISLKKYEIDALISHASTDTTRVHLASVLFDGLLGVCVSTDGHRLMVRHGEAFTGRFLIQRQSLEMVSRILPKNGRAEVSAEAIRILDAAELEIASVKPRLGPQDIFPPYAQVIGGYGSQAKLVPIGLQPKLLLEACKALGSVVSRLKGFV